MHSSTEDPSEVIEGAGEIDARLVVPPELQELYGRPMRMKVRQPATSPPRQESTSAKVTTTTDSKDALDNVDMD